MRVSDEQAQKNRERVIDVAAAQLRTHGINGIGIADLMKLAGMTHGGFYRQFASKDDLVVQAVTRAIETTTDSIKAQLADKPDPLAALIEFYVSTEHRDTPAQGCSLASLATDAARSTDPALKALIGDLVARYLALLSDLAPHDENGQRAAAITTLTGMVGAIVLARAVPDPLLSAELLDVTRAHLLAVNENCKATTEDTI